MKRARHVRSGGGLVAVRRRGPLARNPAGPLEYAIWPGRTDRWLAVDIHTDTVGVEQMTDPPSTERIADGRVYGRGAVDTKATLAVAWPCWKPLAPAGKQPETDLLIAATVDEETGATGTPGFASWLRARNLVLDELVVAEPTGCTPVHGHKGLVRMEFTAHGLTAHSAHPIWAGIAVHHGGWPWHWKQNTIDCRPSPPAPAGHSQIDRGAGAGRHRAKRCPRHLHPSYRPAADRRRRPSP